MIVRWGCQGDFWARDAETAAIRESLDFLHMCVTWDSSDVMEESHGSPGGSVFITNEHLSLSVCEREISKVREGYRKNVPVASAALLTTAWHIFYPSLEAKVSACIRLTIVPPRVRSGNSCWHHLWSPADDRCPQGHSAGYLFLCHPLSTRLYCIRRHSVTLCAAAVLSRRQHSYDVLGRGE